MADVSAFASGWWPPEISPTKDTTGMLPIIHVPETILNANLQLSVGLNSRTGISAEWYQALLLRMAIFIYWHPG